MFTLPTNQRFTVVVVTEKGQKLALKENKDMYVYKSRAAAQRKADELMLITGKKHTVTECLV